LFVFRAALRAIDMRARECPPVGSLAAAALEDQEMSIEEEAGAILEAELANDLSLLRRYYESVHKE
jgi:hypothetical protein